MSMLSHWIQSPIARALGGTLFHFVWEGVAIALLLAAILFFCRAAARLRYAFACIALLAMPLAFAITLARLLPASPAQMAGPFRVPPLSSVVLAPDVLASQTAPASEPIWNRLSRAVPFWMAGVLLFYLRSLGGWWSARQLRRTGVCAVPPEWQERLRVLGRQLRVAKPVVLLESCLTDVPVVIGFLRPVILMPVGLLAGLPAGQLESILIHELAHVRRYDYLINLLQSFVEGLLFYHPAVWWVSAVIRSERENCCDDVVVALHGDARGYAATLAALEENRCAAREPALAATGGSLMRRIRRLLQEPAGPRATFASVFTTGVLLVSLAVALSAWQPQTSPATRIPVAPPLQRKPPELLPAAVTPKAAIQPVRVVAQTQVQARRDLISASGPFDKWLTQDVAYIITDEERATFKSLQTNHEYEQFIEQFWLRRDPTPGTVENEFKEEHYRRIAYANERFAATIPGWKTDRGRIYITYGPPDEIDSYSAGAKYRRPASEGGGETPPFPLEQWHYRYIEGIGWDTVIDFIDPTLSGEYRMTMDPSEKDALQFVQLAGSPVFGHQKWTFVEVKGRTANIIVPLNVASNDRPLHVLARVTTLSGYLVTTFEDGDLHGNFYRKSVTLAPGWYLIEATVSTNAGTAMTMKSPQFEVK